MWIDDDSTSLYRALVEAMPDGVVVIDNLRIVFGNPAAVALAGAESADQIVGRSVADFVSPSSRAKVDDVARRHASGSQPGAVQIDFRRLDGSVLIAEVTTVRVDAMPPWVALVVLKDVTERRIVAERLRRSAALLSSVMRAAAAEAIVVTDTTATVVAFSRGAEDLFGIDAEEVVGRMPMLALHDPDDIARYASGQGLTASQLMRRPPPAGELLNIDLRFRRGDGSTFLGSMNVSTRTDEDGAPVGFLYVVTDITERRRAEEDLLDLVAKDHLTGLLNRRALETRLELMTAEEWWHTPGRVLMFIDLDHFKQVNDSAGHQVGDAVLAEVAERISSCVRVTDAVFRYGGDEFVVVFDATVSLDMAKEVGQRIVQRVREPFIVDRGVAAIGASIGIARSSDGLAPEQLISDADSAVYAAKRRGRGCVVSAV